jgi:glycosyltransferase A (GT-A) superfamily protein (DUF2064 family)
MIGIAFESSTGSFSELQDKSVVLGPDFKGGTYLMGFSKFLLIRAFAKIDWQTSKYLNNYEHFIVTKLGITAPSV